MNLMVKLTKRGFYVDASGNYYMKDGNWFRPLYPHVIHESNVYIISNNGHQDVDNSVNQQHIEKKVVKKSEKEYSPPTTSDEVVCNLTGG